MVRPILATVAAVLFFAGCAANTQTAKVPEPFQTTITGITWKLTSFGNHTMKIPQKAWMRLENGRYEGFAGCNGLSGTYTLDGKNVRFTMDPSTMLACPDMQGETEFRKRLLAVENYKWENGMLELQKEGKKLLVFLPANDMERE